MLRIFPLLIVFIFTLWGPLASAQDVDESMHIVEVTLNLASLPDDVSLDDVQILLDQTPIEAAKIVADGPIRIAVPTGKNRLKAFVPGQGADLVKIDVKPDATGTYEITLSPHLIGLTTYIDDYTLAWVNGVKPDYVPTSVAMDLKFVDDKGDLLPVTKIMDAYIQGNYPYTETVNVTDLFTAADDGSITLTDKPRFLQKVVDFKDTHKFIEGLVVRARDANSGIDYEAKAGIRLAPVAVSGRVVLGDSVDEDFPLEEIKVSFGGTNVKTDSEGRFSVGGVPAGEISFSGYHYIRKPYVDPKTMVTSAKRTTVKRYRARGTFDLSGPAEVEIILERRKSGVKAGVVKLLSHEPASALITPSRDVSETSDIIIPPIARFKLINLIANPVPFPDWETMSQVEAYCTDAYKRGWQIQPYCPNHIRKTWAAPVKIWAGPQADDRPLGELYNYAGGAWFVSQGDRQTSRIIPEYNLSDWGYGTYGYAVTALDFKNGRVAIHLPHGQEAGWIDLAELLGKNTAEDTDFEANAEWAKSYSIGFSPLETCGTDFGGQTVFVEGMSEDSFTYREPTPHDLWSDMEDDGERPALENYESITLPWERAYSADGKLILVPNEGKEC